MNKLPVLFAAVLLLASAWSQVLAQETLGPEWRVHSRGLVQGVEHMCVTNGSQLICGRTLPTLPGKPWTLSPQVTCDASGTQCQRYSNGLSEAERAVILQYLLQQSQAPIYLPPPPVYTNPGIDAGRGMIEGLQRGTPPPPVQCNTQPNGRGWSTICR